MPSDRDLAQQFLADRMVEIHVSAWGVLPDQAGRNYLAGVARMLLDTPGVEVARILRPLEGTERLVIWLPAELSAQRSGVTEQEQDRTEEQG